MHPPEITPIDAICYPELPGLAEVVVKGNSRGAAISGSVADRADHDGPRLIEK